MQLSQFFIRRPIFAGVLSFLILLLGAISLFRLPVSEYPEVVPPSIVVRATYPGANARTIAETVASPLEQSINGVENALYMSSQAASDGVMTLTVTFKLGTDVDKAQVQVQNRVSQALPQPARGGARAGSHDDQAVARPDHGRAPRLAATAATTKSTCATSRTLQVKDELARIPGVGDVEVFAVGELRHARLARPRQARRARPDRRRRGGRDP